MSIGDNYRTISEAARTLKIHPGTVKRLCREGKIVAEKIHNTWLIHKDNLDFFANGYTGSRGRPLAK